MAVKTSIVVNDGLSPAFKSMNKVMGVILSNFEAIQTASGKAIDTTTIKYAKNELANVNLLLKQTEDYIRDNTEEQENFNEALNRGQNSADKLNNNIGKVVKSYLGIQSIRKGASFVSDVLGMADIQNASETQLATVLRNVGATENAFDKLKAKASEIQSRGIYGDEAMLGGAAELATYISDTSAIEHMVDTLSNYAVGMSGGGAVDKSAMVDYATQLGKALDGTYDGLTKKGFTLSDAQKQIIENGTDMQKALVLDEVINQSWANLYETMSNTPASKIIRLQNTWGDMKEEIGNKLYPAVGRLFDTIQQNMPTIEKVMNGVTTGLSTIIGILNIMITGISNVASFVADNWSIISPILTGVGVALGLYLFYLGAIKAAEIAGTAVKLVSTLATVAYAVATGHQAAATRIATNAQLGLNAALLASPITWIIIAIIALIAIIYAVVAAINKVTGSSISALGIICGAIAVAGAFIYNTYVGVVNAITSIIDNFMNWIIGGVEWALNAFNGGFNSFGDAVANLIGNIISWFIGLGKVVTTIIDAIFGSNWTAGLTNLQNQVTSWGKNDKAITLERWNHSLDRIEYGNAWNSGYSFGQGIENKISDFFNPAAGDNNSILNSLGSNTAAIADNTGKISDSLDMADEDIKHLLDLAERDVINRFTTAEIKIDFSNTNHIQNDTDLDGIVEHIKNAIYEGVTTAAEEVHA